MDGQRSFMNVFSSLAYCLMKKTHCLTQSDFDSTLQMVVTHQKLKFQVSVSLILAFFYS